MTRLFHKLTHDRRWAWATVIAGTLSGAAGVLSAALLHLGGRVALAYGLALLAIVVILGAGVVGHLAFDRGYADGPGP
jgi:branched-subunit amino acid ABC-type transport system permease component